MSKELGLPGCFWFLKTTVIDIEHQVHTQYPIRWDYIFEGTHTTAGGYVDTLKFNIGRPASPDAGTTMRVFSLSRIHGALGDNGQNYKNIKYMIENHEAKIVLGCGA